MSVGVRVTANLYLRNRNLLLRRLVSIPPQIRFNCESRHSGRARRPPVGARGGRRGGDPGSRTRRGPGENRRRRGGGSRVDAAAGAATSTRGRRGGPARPADGDGSGRVRRRCGRGRDREPGRGRSRFAGTPVAAVSPGRRGRRAFLRGRPRTSFGGTAGIVLNRGLGASPCRSPTIPGRLRAGPVILVDQMGVRILPREPWRQALHAGGIVPISGR